MASAVRQALTLTADHPTGPVVGNAFDVNFGLRRMARLAKDLRDTRTRPAGRRDSRTSRGSGTSPRDWPSASRPRTPRPAEPVPSTARSCPRRRRCSTHPRQQALPRRSLPRADSGRRWPTWRRRPRSRRCPRARTRCTPSSPTTSTRPPPTRVARSSRSGGRCRASSGRPCRPGQFWAALSAPRRQRMPASRNASMSPSKTAWGLPTSYSVRRSFTSW